MKRTANITKKYFCPSLILSFFVYLYFVSFGAAFFYFILVKVDDILVKQWNTFERKWSILLLSYCIWLHLSSIVTILVFTQFRDIFINSWNKKLWVLICYIFLFTYLLHTELFSLGKKIAYSSIINEKKKYRMLTFSFIKLINTGNIHESSARKNFYEQCVYVSRNYIHYDQKPHTFRLLIKYLQIFKIFSAEIKKYAKLSTQNKCLFTFIYLFTAVFIFFFSCS